MVKKYKNILFRCDASSTVGYGHFSRCLSICEKLASTHDWKIHFAMLNSLNASKRFKNLGYEVFNKTMPKYSSNEEGSWLKSLVKSLDISVLLLDVRSELPLSTIKELKKSGIIIVTIDDPSNRRIFADLAFYPPVPQVHEMKWDKFMGELYSGWDWIPLKSTILQARNKKNSLKKSTNQSVYITMGGSDPAGLTLKVLHAIDSLKNIFDTNIIIGPEFSDISKLNRFLSSSKRQYKIINGGYDISEIILHADIGIISFGVTAYELASLGIPTIILSLSDDHFKSASVFENESMSINLGNYKNLSDEIIRRNLLKLLKSKIKLKKMKEKNLLNVDAMGSIRIAEKIDKFFIKITK